ncbi:MAG: pyruvate ferredoxin oxidoreductase, partial [Bacillota bacterium]
NEVRSAMYDYPGPKIVSYIYGLGGRDVGTADITRVYDHLLAINKAGKVDSLLNYLGVRE